MIFSQSVVTRAGGVEMCGICLDLGLFFIETWIVIHASFIRSPSQPCQYAFVSDMSMGCWYMWHVQLLPVNGV